MTLAARRPEAADGFHHEALFYSGLREFLSGAVPFVREGLYGGEAVLVALPRPRLGVLREALGDDGDRVVFVDMERLGRNPARIIPAWHEFVAEHSGWRGVRGIGEPVWPGRTDEELVECHRHEHLLNVAFAGAPGGRMLCPYDVGALDAGIVAGARFSHPWITFGDRRAASPEFSGPDGPRFDPPLPPPPPYAVHLPFAADSVRAVRRLAAELAARAGLGHDATDDLGLAVHEVATNSVHHGGGSGVMRGWLTAKRVVCQIEDAGHIRDPLAGRVPPPLDGLSGRGLWLANRLCELVQIRTSPAGTVVRLHMAA